MVAGRPLPTPAGIGAAVTDEPRVRMRPVLTACSLFLLAGSIQGQVRSDRPVQLNGTPQQAQLLGISASTTGVAPLNAQGEQQGVFRMANAVFTDTWSVTLPSLPQAAAGTVMHLVPPAAWNGPVFLSVNGAPPLPLLMPADGMLVPALPAPGQPMTVVHAGDHYQQMDGTVHGVLPCPDGMSAVNEQYCIEQVERNAAPFLDAASTCASLGRRLCSWAEHHAACTRRVELGLGNMNNDWEWTNNTSNEENSVRMVAFGSCTNAGNRLLTAAPATFHCCFTR
jgi:hypothetical protein